MNNLPQLVLESIFKFLNFNQRLNASMVCKNWRSVIQLKKQEFLFLHFDLFPFNLKCSYSNEIIRYENSIQIKNFKFIQSNLSRYYFKDLKTLHIFNLEQYEINITNLGIIVNNFKELIKLCLTKLRLKEKTTLNLPKLNLLILKNVLISEQLDLNTYELETLICWSDLERIKFRYPKRLINLEYKNSNNEFNYLNLEFTNLEHLKYFDVIGLTKCDFLKNLKKLKQLIIYTPFVEHDLKELTRQKKYYNLDQLQILSFGFNNNINFPINNNYIYLLDKFKLKEFNANYDQLIADISFPIQIDFCSFKEHFDRIPIDFFQKLNQIQVVNICWNDSNLIENCLPLIDFISNCNFLSKLILNNCGFNQLFYDKLSSMNSSIGQLEIIESKLNVQNYIFLSKMILFHLKIYLNKINLHLLINTLLNCNIKYFDFFRKNFKLSIKNYNNQFQIDINNQLINKFDYIEDVYEYFKNDDKIKLYIE